MNISLYTWRERLHGVVEIHSPKLFQFLREQRVTINEKWWEGAPETTSLARRTPGLVSVSRSLLSQTSWEPPVYALTRLGDIVAGCGAWGHAAFSRDRLLKLEVGQHGIYGSYGDWDELKRAVEIILREGAFLEQRF